jgi:hypothetical protein
MWTMRAARRWLAHRRDPVLGVYAIVPTVCRRLTPASRDQVATVLDSMGRSDPRSVTSRVVLVLLANWVRGGSKKLERGGSAVELLADTIAPNTIIEGQRELLLFEARALALALDSGRITVSDLARAIRAY